MLSWRAKLAIVYSCMAIAGFMAAYIGKKLGRNAGLHRTV